MTMHMHLYIHNIRGHNISILRYLRNKSDYSIIQHNFSFTEFFTPTSFTNFSKIRKSRVGFHAINLLEFLHNHQDILLCHQDIINSHQNILIALILMVSYFRHPQTVTDYVVNFKKISPAMGDLKKVNNAQSPFILEVKVIMIHRSNNSYSYNDNVMSRV